MSKKYRAFAFTLNNYTPEEYNTLKELDCRYYIIAQELAPSTLTPHLQGYIYFKHQHTLSAAIKICPRAHWEIAHADTDHNINYCKKGEESPDETDYCFKGKYYKGNGVYIEKGEAPCTNKAQRGMLYGLLSILNEISLFNEKKIPCWETIRGSANPQYDTKYLQSDLADCAVIALEQFEHLHPHYAYPIFDDKDIVIDNNIQQLMKDLHTECDSDECLEEND